MTSSTNCARCGAPFVDQTTLVEQERQTYCCPTCLAVARGEVHPATPGRVTCAHCQAPIADKVSQVERVDQTFCCLNCATAMAQAATPTVGRASA